VFETDFIPKTIWKVHNILSTRKLKQKGYKKTKNSKRRAEYSLLDHRINGDILGFKVGKVKVKLPLCLSKHHSVKTYWGMEVASRILNLDTRWMCVVNFTPQQFYSRGKSPRYPLERRLGGP
jgi:hypothetical protein